MGTSAVQRLFVLLPILAVFGCATSPPSPAATPIEAARLVPASAPIDLMDDADPQSLLTAVDQSLIWLKSLPQDSEFDYGIRTVRASEMVQAFTELSAFLRGGPEAANQEGGVD
jgi:hypothetical protein